VIHKKLAWLLLISRSMVRVYNGVKHVDKGLLEVGQSFSATRVQSWRHIVLPSAVPFIVTGLSQGVAMGMVGMFIAEISTQLSGLGSALTAQANAYHTARVLGIILIIMSMGVTFRTIMRMLERKVAPWFAQS
jgi:ABC-type nitrate/sulfonate/bicarbonate transport system permease component